MELKSKDEEERVTRQETSRVSILLEEDPTVHQDEEDDPDFVDEREIVHPLLVSLTGFPFPLSMEDPGSVPSVLVLLFRSRPSSFCLFSQKNRRRKKGWSDLYLK